MKLSEKKKKEEQFLAVKRKKEEYSLLGDSWIDESEIPLDHAAHSIADLEHYSYFLAKRILESMNIDGKIFLEGANVQNAGKIIIMRGIPKISVVHILLDY